MFTRRHLLYLGTAAAALAVLRLARPHVASAEGRVYEVTHSEDEWRKLLTLEQFNVLRREGTERPFTSALLNEHRKEMKRLFFLNVLQNDPEELLRLYRQDLPVARH